MPRIKRTTSSQSQASTLADERDDPSESLSIPSEPTEPLVSSYTWSSPIPSACTANPSGGTSDGPRVPCMLGVDEAGRGPVLGPLVYGIAYCPLSYQPTMERIGFADSKALTSDRRSTLLSALTSHSAHLGWAVRVMSPQDISAGMLRRRPTNLNAQSAQATVSLIARVLGQGVDLTEIYVDTVGDPKAYARLLSSHFPRHPHIKWTVTSKADAIYPIVGAASIAAKVTRDRCIERWRYAESSTSVPAQHVGPDGPPSILADRTNTASDADEIPPRSRKRKADTDIDTDTDTNPNTDGDGIHPPTAQSSTSHTAHHSARPTWPPPGSGYPSDPHTVAFLKSALDPIFGWPGIVRFSWATAKTLLDEKIRPAPPRTGPRRSQSDPTDTANEPAAEPTVLCTWNQHGSRLPSTGTRGYKVKWIDEPVSIAKFFAAGAKGSAGSGAGEGSAIGAAARAEGASEEEVRALERMVTEERRCMSQGGKTEGGNVGRMARELGLVSCGAGFEW